VNERTDRPYQIELTGIAKSGGALTKRISLASDGSLLSDGSECTMATGTAWRQRWDTLHEFGACITALEPHEAIALGALRGDLPGEVKVVTKSHLEKLNGSGAGLIARTADHISYRTGQPALALIDIDCKGMPASVRNLIDEIGGFWPALVEVMPELAHTARVVRSSTSTGISRSDTGEKLPGSNGLHVFLLVQDGADIERFLRVLHDRCWLAGLGWMMVGAGGALLERSIVDRMVCSPERLVFEGAPVLDPPLLQDLASRQAIAHDGAPLDTVTTCPPLTIVEQSLLRDLRAKDEHRLAPDRAKARSKFVTDQSARIVTRTGCSVPAARRTVERQCEGVLQSDVELPFDDAELAGCTVADVLATPDRFVGATLADPLEGVAYGRCKAMIMRRSAGEMWVNSFAHGRTTYELRHSAGAIEAALAEAPDDQLAASFVQLAAAGDLTGEEQQRLRDSVAKRSGVGKRTLDQGVKEAREQQDARRRQEQRNQRAAERRDPRPRIGVPTLDATFLPQIGVLNDVLGSSDQAIPPGRDIDGERSRLKMRTLNLLHLLQPTTTDPDQEIEA
jgi:hypothetical protein